MNPLALILWFGLLAFTALALFLLRDFAGPLAVAVAVVLLVLFLLRR